VRAITSATAAMPPLVMNIFSPLIRQPRRRATAVDVRDAGIAASVGLGEREAAEALPRRHRGSQSAC
jgi:hypothetical protein